MGIPFTQSDAVNQKGGSHMPWKFLTVLVILVLFVVFIGLNLDYKTNVSFGFYTFENVPGFLIIIISFLIGALVTLPISLFSGMRKKNKKIQKLKDQQEPESEETGIIEPKKGKKNKKK
jgi:uncharacterized integral membrane protein